MRQLLLFLFSLLAGLAVFWLITVNVGWHDIVEPLFLLDVWKILALLLITFVIVFSNVFKWQFILRVLGCKVALKDIFGPWVAGSTLNYLTPIALLGGEVAMVAGLRQKYPQFSLSDNIASVVVVRILNLSAAILVLVLGVFLFLGKVSSLPEDISLALTLFAILILAIMAFFYYRSFKKESIISWLTQILERIFGINQKLALEVERRTFAFFQRGNSNMWKGLLLSAFIGLLGIVRVGLIIFFLINSMVSLSDILSVSAFMHLAYIVALPATLGSLEVSEAFAFSSLGLGSALGTAFSLILRAVELAAVLVGAVFLLRMWLILNLRLWQSINHKSINNKIKI